MKRKRYMVEHIASVVKQHKLETPVADIIVKLGIAEATFYRWKKQYGGLDPDQARELDQLREENSKLKRLVADFGLDKAMLNDMLSKNVWSPGLARILTREASRGMHKCFRAVYGPFDPGHDGNPHVTRLASWYGL